MAAQSEVLKRNFRESTSTGDISGEDDPDELPDELIDAEDEYFNEELKVKTEEDHLKEKLETVDLSHERSHQLGDKRFSYAEDFCIKIAATVESEHEAFDSIRQLMENLAYTRKKKEILSYSLQLYTAVLKRYIIKYQLKKINSILLGKCVLEASEMTQLEARCIAVFKKISLEDIVNSIDYEFYVLLNKLANESQKSSEKEKTYDLISRLAFRFIEGKYIESIIYLAKKVRDNPDEFIEQYDIKNLIVNEQHVETVVTKIAHYFLYALENIRSGLKKFTKEKEYSHILTKNKRTEQQSSSSIQVLVTFDYTFEQYFLEMVRKQSQLEKELAERTKKTKETSKRTETEKTEDDTTQPEVNTNTFNGLDSSGKDEEDLVTDQILSVPRLLAHIESIKKESMPQHLDKFPRAFSIVTDLDATRNSSLHQRSLDSPPGDTIRKMLILKLRVGQESCSCTKSDEIAAMLDRCPLVEAVNDAGAIRASILKFLRLYPGSTQVFGPYLIILEASAAMVGTLTATDGILNPKKTRLAVRIWKATTNGCVILICSLNASINIYLAVYPDRREITEKTFYTEIASLPLFFMCSHALWHSISPHQKEIWFPRDQLPYFAARKTIDFFLDTLYNAGIFLFSGINFFNLPKTLFYQLFPLIPGGMVALGNQISKLKGPLNTLMTYITFSIFATMLFKDELPNSPDHEFEDTTHVIVRAFLLGSLTLYSIHLFVKNYNRFLRDYVNEENEAIAELFAHPVEIPLVNGVPDYSSYEGKGQVVDHSLYYALVESVEKGDVNEVKKQYELAQQQAPVIFSSTSKKTTKQEKGKSASAIRNQKTRIS